MPSRFAAIEARVSQRVDGLYGEPVRVQPRSIGDFSSEGDPERPAYDTVGVVDFKPSVAQFKGIGRHDGDYADVEGDAVQFSFNVPKLPTDRNRWPKQNDLLQLLTRESDNLFKIITVEPDGIGRIMCRCVRAKNAF